MNSSKMVDGIEFREVPGFPGYFVSSSGTVLSSRKNKKAPYLKPMRPMLRRGYVAVNCCIDNVPRKMSVHRAVAGAWIGLAPDTMSQVNHKNGIKRDNRAENLEWVTAKENQMHARSVLGKERKGERHPLAKLTDRQVREIRASWKALKPSYAALGRQHRVTPECIANVVKGNTWAHVEN